jgi:hypothetical protein
LQKVNRGIIFRSSDRETDMLTIAKKEVGDHAVSIIEGQNWDGRTVYLVEKLYIPQGRQMVVKRFFNKQAAAAFGRGLIAQMAAH